MCIHTPVDMAPQFSVSLGKKISLFVTRTYLSVYNLLSGKYVNGVTQHMQPPDPDGAGQGFFCMSILTNKIYCLAPRAKRFLQITTSPDLVRNGTRACVIQTGSKTRHIWGKAGMFTNTETVFLFFS